MVNPHFASLTAEAARVREEETQKFLRKVDEAKLQVTAERVAAELRLAALVGADGEESTMVQVPRKRLEEWAAALWPEDDPRTQELRR